MKNSTTNINTAISHTIGRELSAHEIFRIIVAITQDYPKSNLWELYTKREIEKAHEKKRHTGNAILF